MRYNPATDNAVANERAQAALQFTPQLQTSRLTLAKEPQPQAATSNRVDWAGLEAGEFRCAKLGLKLSHGLVNCASLSHGIAVAEAMGNWPEARRLRAQLIAGLW